MGLSTEELKYVCLVGTFLAGLCGMLALVFRSERYERRREVIFSYLNAFAGGIFLSVGLLHMMVDSTEDLEDYLKDHYCSDYEDCDPYPLGFFMVGMGYLSVFFIEKVVFAKIYKRAAKKTGGKLHIHSHDNDTKKCYDNVKAKESLSGNVYDPDVLEVESEWSEDGEIDQKTTNLYAVTLLCVISIHSLFAGLGLGISEGDSDIIAQMIAIIAHKGVAAFCIGSCLVKSSLGGWLAALCLFCFACVTPIGIGIGIAASTADNESVTAASGVLVSFSAGIFIYIASMLLASEFHSHQFRKFLCACLGFAIMAIAAIWA